MAHSYIAKQTSNDNLNPDKYFWPYVRKLDECWQWVGEITKYGYARHRYAPIKRMNRYSYTLHLGNIPEGIHVCHTCDNRYCVNPSHLFLGTNKINMMDKAIKCRSKSKLTRDQVLEIKEKIKCGESLASIGRFYGVNRTAIQKIKNRTNWAHVV